MNFRFKLHIKKFNWQVFITTIIIIFVFYPPYELGQSAYYIFFSIKFFLGSYYIIRYLYNNRGNVSLQQLDILIILWILVSCLSTFLNLGLKKTVIAFADKSIQYAIFSIFMDNIKKSRHTFLFSSVLFLGTYIVCTIPQIQGKMFSMADYLLNEVIYFAGGKFDTCYLLILFSYLLIEYIGIKKLSGIVKIMVILGVDVGLGLALGCATGVLGMLAVGVLYIVPDRIYKKIKERFVLLIIVITDFSIFGLQAILSAPAVQYVIVNVFHKEAHLTGRLALYGKLKNAILASPIFGFGNQTEALMKYTGGYGNTQNGLVEIIYQTGIVGLFIYLCFLFKYIKQVLMLPLHDKKMTLAFLGGFVICSIVEVTFTSWAFILFIYFSFAISYEKSQYSVLKKHKVGDVPV